jgi:excinuclease UvrABC nuclease subunit
MYLLLHLLYLNADLEKITIIKQNKSKSGIYRWINVINNKNYIGSSIDLGRRFKEYYNYNHISKIRRNFPIHSALLKYSYSSFKLEILEYCDINNLLKREQYYLDNLKPEYNVLKIANNYKSIPVILTNINTGDTIKFSSKSKAAQFLNVSETTVRNYIKWNKSCKGYTIIIE